MKLKCFACKNVDLIIEEGRCPYCLGKGYIFVKDNLKDYCECGNIKLEEQDICKECL